MKQASVLGLVGKECICFSSSRTRDQRKIWGEQCLWIVTCRIVKQGDTCTAEQHIAVAA